MRKITKRSAAIIAASVIAVGGGAAAWAANGWGVTGEGEATAKASDIKKLTASADLGATKRIYPGLVTTVNTSVANPNDFPVNLTAGKVTPTDVTVTGGADATACKNGLTEDMLVANLPAARINAGATAATVTANVTIGSIPASCASSSILLKYTFAGTSTV